MKHLLHPLYYTMKGNYMYTPQTILPAFIAAVLLGLLQTQNVPPELKNMGGEAGLYAFLFLIVKELIQFLLKFRKNPLETQINANNQSITTLTNSVTIFLNKIQSIEEERNKSLKDMKPAISQMNEGIVTLVERTKNLDIKNKKKRKRK